MSTLGLVQVFTGNGKGKTSASLGIALRAVGQGFKVYMIQFLKSGDTGELFSVKKYLPNIKIVQFGKEALEEQQVKIFQFDGEGTIKPVGPKNGKYYIFLPDREEQEPSRRALEHAFHVANSGQYDILILDEINNALAKGLVTIEEVLKLIDEKPDSVELILTGRDCPEEIRERADLVSDIREVKHPFSKGILARRGIDY
ncbi:cob(I)yrinic acid a,c-diamide adenosyltransferase [Candidatus Woesearchaeota archaeon]|nr:cob(I)yrinic acid a,c-diamide adenosyltransferase [Candidatus Woesearchaeota archaeon]